MQFDRRDVLFSGLAAAMAFGAGSSLTLLSGCTSGSTPSEPKRRLAHDAPPLPPAEFRGAWVASVANIDWPSKKGLGAAELRAEMTRILDRCAELRLNAVLLQVRPSCDAIYPSPLEPWSEFLTGASGKPPEPEFDPLAEWIEQAHARGLELHVWFNPFRARHHKAQLPDAPTHITNTRPDLVRTWGELKWLDPSEPDAREHSLSVILDVVNRYDIDGVHLDDYFYPYPRDAKPLPGEIKSTRKEEFPDDHQWAIYQKSGGTLPRSDWRRWHIDTFVRDLYQRVKAARPGVMVGLSPFGIWRPGHPTGVEGFDAYEGLFADARKWLREGWVDYMAPQLYWAVESPKQPFGALLDWWRSENPKHKFIWPGLYTSRIEGEGKWKPEEIARQITATRERPTRGHMHFSMVALLENRAGVSDLLTRTLYAQDTLVPSLDQQKDSSVQISAFTTQVEAAARGSDSGATPVRIWWAAKQISGGASAARRWIVQAQYGSSWRTSAFPPSHTGTDVPGADADGVPLDRLVIVRIDSRRRSSNSVVLQVPRAIGSSDQPSPGS